MSRDDPTQSEKFLCLLLLVTLDQLLSIPDILHDIFLKTGNVLDGTESLFNRILTDTVNSTSIR